MAIKQGAYREKHTIDAKVGEEFSFTNGCDLSLIKQVLYPGSNLILRREGSADKPNSEMTQSKYSFTAASPGKYCIEFRANKMRMAGIVYTDLYTVTVTE